MWKKNSSYYLFLFAFFFSLAFAPVTAQDSLTQTYEDGMLSFNYPEGWATHNEGGIVFLANNAALIEERAHQPGEIRIDFTTPPIVAADWMFLDTSSTNALASQVARGMTTSDPNNMGTVVDSSDVTVGDYPATVVHMTHPDMDRTIIALEVGGGSLMVLDAVTAPHEMGSFEPLLLSIAESIQYEEPSFQPALQLPESRTEFRHALSADGSLLAVLDSPLGQKELRLTVMNLDSDTLISQTQGSYPQSVIVLSPDDSTILAATINDAILYDLNGNERVSLEPQRHGQNFAFSPDGRLVASGTKMTGCIFLWDATTGVSLPSVCNDMGGRPIVVGFTADQSAIITTSGLWDVQTGQIEKFEGEFLGLLPDGSVITRAEVVPFVGEPLAVRADGRVLGYREGYLVLYDPNTGTAETLFTVPTIYSDLTSNATGTRVVAFSDLGSSLDVYVWDIP